MKLVSTTISLNLFFSKYFKVSSNRLTKKEQTVFKIFEYTSMIVKFVCHVLSVVSQYSCNFGLETEGHYSLKC